MFLDSYEPSVLYQFMFTFSAESWDTDVSPDVGSSCDANSKPPKIQIKRATKGQTPHIKNGFRYEQNRIIENTM